MLSWTRYNMTSFYLVMHTWHEHPLFPCLCAHYTSPDNTDQNYKSGNWSDRVCVESTYSQPEITTIKQGYTSLLTKQISSNLRTNTFLANLVIK